MKKVIIIAIGLMSTVYAQWDSSKYVYNLPLQARIVSYLAPRTTDPTNDSLFNVFIKWRASKKITTAKGRTVITIDSIPAYELAQLYDFVLGMPEGMNMGTIMRTQIRPARQVNKYFEALCTAIEAKWLARQDEALSEGDKLLLGK